MTDFILKIGTRGSPLALRQTEMVEAALAVTHPSLKTERVIIRTSGDWRPEDGEKRLSEIEGGKGLFAREIERALLAGEIDCAVHSLKDMPSFLPEGLALDHTLERADPRDAFVSHTSAHYRDLPMGAVVGTSSRRRQAFLLSQRPDITIVPLRGNVQTRLDKLKEGLVDATFLARAGLDRLGIAGDYIYTIDPADMVPACGQGIVAIETRLDDARTRSLLDPVHHIQTGLCAAVERAALQVLDGSCHTPIGAHAKPGLSGMDFDLVVVSMDGKRIYEERVLGADVQTIAEAIALGHSLGTKLKSVAPADIFV